MQYQLCIWILFQYFFNNYFNLDFIFNPDIRKTDTLWKYVSDQEYNKLTTNLKSIKNLNDIFVEKQKDLKKIGQSSFYILLIR